MKRLHYIQKSVVLWKYEQSTNLMHAHNNHIFMWRNPIGLQCCLLGLWKVQWKEKNNPLKIWTIYKFDACTQQSHFYVEKSNWVTVLFAGTLKSAMKGEKQHKAPTTSSPNAVTLQSPLSPSP